MPAKSATLAAQEAQQEDEQSAAEQYAIWKKNVKLLYDMVISHALEWPSLTLQWMPDKEVVADKGYVRHKLILGTHTSGEDQESLLVAEVKLPMADTDLDTSTFETADKRQPGLISTTEGRVSIAQSILHEGEVNRARYMPQRPSIVATKSPSSEIFIFDLEQHPSEPAGKNPKPKPNMRLRGHDAEGFGLSWNSFHQGRLLSGSNDSLICMWETAEGGKVVEAATSFTRHKDAVNDVAWHCGEADLFGSVSDDKMLMLWDCRQSSETSSTEHPSSATCLAFHPTDPFLLVTGSGGSGITLFDRRKLGSKLHAMEGHTGDTKTLVWSPHHPTILASTATDKRVIIWDLGRIGEEQSEEDAADGPSELLFIHSGHTAEIEDVAWSVTEPWVIASVDNDNLLQVWQPAENIYDE